jgi:hypothetical protein
MSHRTGAEFRPVAGFSHIAMVKLVRASARLPTLAVEVELGKCRAGEAAVGAEVVGLLLGAEVGAEGPEVQAGSGCVVTHAAPLESMRPGVLGDASNTALSITIPTARPRVSVNHQGNKTHRLINPPMCNGVTTPFFPPCSVNFTVTVVVHTYQVYRTERESSIMTLGQMLSRGVGFKSHPAGSLAEAQPYNSRFRHNQSWCRSELVIVGKVF